MLASELSYLLVRLIESLAIKCARDNDSDTLPKFHPLQTKFASLRRKHNDEFNSRS